MTDGYRGEGVFHSAPMDDDATIEKGDVLAFNADGNLTVAPTGEDEPAGVAAETKTSAVGENPEVAYIVHGVAGVTATTAISAGEAIVPSATEAGEVESQAVIDETVSALETLGKALEDIAAGATGDVFVR